MEGDYTWHGKPPNKEQADAALRELALRVKGLSRMLASRRLLATPCELEFVPTRNGFGEGLIEAGDRNPNVLANLRRSRRIDAHGRLQEGASRRNTSRSASPSKCSLRLREGSRRSVRFRGSRPTRCSIRGARGSKCARSWRSTKAMSRLRARTLEFRSVPTARRTKRSRISRLCA